MREVVLKRFHEVFETAPKFIVRAPGRANLIGEHTDYNDGFVLPFAVDRAVWIAGRQRDDNIIRVFTLDYGETIAEFTTSQLQDNWPHWTTYIRGAWWLLQVLGQPPKGVDVVIGSDIPAGGGMSSSAAVSVGAIETVLAVLDVATHSQKEKALLGVRIEREFVGLPVGVMDQMASAVPDADAAILLDCRSLETINVKIPLTAQVVVINSMKERQLVGSPYAERRRQCEEASEILGVAALRDTTLAAVEAHRKQLGDVRYRRARHVVTENKRTLQTVELLAKDDLAAVGNLLNASHVSLRDDYETSVAELDILTEIARQHPSCYGARIMGGGFGGCAVSLLDPTGYKDFVAHVEKIYSARTNLAPEFYMVSPTRGSHVELF